MFFPVLITPGFVGSLLNMPCSGILVGKHQFPCITVSEFWHAGKFQ